MLQKLLSLFVLLSVMTFSLTDKERLIYSALLDKDSPKQVQKKEMKEKFLNVGVASNYDQYFAEAASYYSLPVIILKKIALIESNMNPNVIGHNKNGSTDFGIMQVNSCHFSELAQFGIGKSNIMNPRINIFSGAYLIKKHIMASGFTYQSISNYHSKTPYYNNKYKTRLIQEINKDNYYANNANYNKDNIGRSSNNRNIVQNSNNRNISQNSNNRNIRLASN